MKMKWTPALLVLLFCLVLALPAAAEEANYILDSTGVLTDSELRQLEASAQELHAQYNVEVLFALLPGNDSQELMAYSQSDDRVGAGADCILLVVNDSYWNAHFWGESVAFGDSENERSLGQAFNDGQTYYDGVRNYLLQAERILQEHLPGEDTGGVGSPLLVDAADLLPADQEASLLSQLQDISSRQAMDVVVLTVSDLSGMSPRDYADNYYDSHGYGQGANLSGVLLLHCPESRDWWISTSGAAITVFTDVDLDYIGRMVAEKLAQGDAAAAYELFAVQCDRLIEEAKQGGALNSAKPGLPWFWVPISLLLGFVIAWLIVGHMRRKLTNLPSCNDAGSYIRPDSLKMETSRELFLYKHVVRTRRETDRGPRGGSSTHRSKSGASHGGRGGKY